MASSLRYCHRRGVPSVPRQLSGLAECRPARISGILHGSRRPMASCESREQPSAGRLLVDELPVPAADWRSFQFGTSFLLFGLAKTVILADNLAVLFLPLCARFGWIRGAAAHLADASAPAVAALVRIFERGVLQFSAWVADLARHQCLPAGLRIP
jgi:hypothetical protein